MQLTKTEIAAAQRHLTEMRKHAADVLALVRKAGDGQAVMDLQFIVRLIDGIAGRPALT